jgi:large subunit ribosomal protein L9
MEVVLRQDVDSLGLRGEVVNVARGYARNFLLPRGLAELATPAIQKELAKRDAQRARSEAKTVDEARAIAARIEGKELRFDVNAGPTGSLFGSVTATDVADRLWSEQKIRVDRRKLKLDTIKRIGRYTVPLELFTDVTVELKLVVAPEGQELPSEAELEAAAAAEAAAAEAEVQAAAVEHQVAVEAEAQAIVVEDTAPEDEDLLAEPTDEPAAEVEELEELADNE